MGFTLLELIIVIGIVGVLASVVVLVINPIELLNRARDGTRIQDLQSVNDAIKLYDVNGGTSFGTSSTVYISIPDTSATCANLTLPTPPSGWSYACVTEANLQDVDGTGWIPVDFVSIPGGSPIPKLPTDPTNSATDSLYYAYVAGGSWKLNAVLQAGKNLDIASSDGGVNVSTYEVGSDLQLAPFLYDGGLPGFRDFNNWTLNGNATVDADGVLHLYTYGDSAASPLIPLNEQLWEISAEFFTTVTSDNFSPDGGMLWGTSYYDVNYAPKANSGGWAGNGNAQMVSKNSWESKSWNMNGYTTTGIVYIQFNISSGSPYSSPSYDVRNVVITTN